LRFEFGIIEPFAKIKKALDPQTACGVACRTHEGFPKGEALWPPEAEKLLIFARPSIVF
jgi:hypothetical protein